MVLDSTESVRRNEIESLVRVLPGIEADKEEIRQQAINAFIKKLDAKIKNLQDGEALAVIFSIDIVSKDGKVRGGSGAERNMPEYIEWRQSVYKRDNYTCQKCGSRNELNAHHIVPWSFDPLLRFDINNGVTLCRNCHAKEHPHLKIFNQ